MGRSVPFSDARFAAWVSKARSWTRSEA